MSPEENEKAKHDILLSVITRTKYILKRLVLHSGDSEADVAQFAEWFDTLEDCGIEQNNVLSVDKKIPRLLRGLELIWSHSSVIQTNKDDVILREIVARSCNAENNPTVAFVLLLL